MLGFRWAGAWAFVLLTKASCGVGLLWFVVRREWRPLLVAGIVTGALVLASLVTHGSQWPGYIDLVTSGASPAVAPYYLPLWVRLPPAIALIVIGARLGWRWTVVAGSTLALPVFYIISWSMLVGMLPFIREAGGHWLAGRGWSLERTRRPVRPAARPRGDDAVTAQARGGPLHRLVAGVVAGRARGHWGDAAAGGRREPLGHALG